MLFAVIVPLAYILALTFPASRAVFQAATETSPYIMGFFKFAFLATTGEILARRISDGAFSFPPKVMAKSIIWGVIGMMIALLFPFYSAGVQAAQDAGLLPGRHSFVATAVLTSVINNFTFGIVMMIAHRITDTMIEMRADRRKATVIKAVEAIDWPGFVSFVIFRTIPFFWIPAHSVTFMLAPQYRVILSAFLSIALGLLLAVARKKKKT